MVYQILKGFSKRDQQKENDIYLSLISIGSFWFLGKSELYIDEFVTCRKCGVNWLSKLSTFSGDSIQFLY